jgi:hypothetical protein
MRLPWSPGRSARSVGRPATDVIALVCLAPTDDLHHDKPEARVAARLLKPHEPPVLPIRDAATKVAVTAAVPDATHVHVACYWTGTATDATDPRYGCPGTNDPRRASCSGSIFGAPGSLRHRHMRAACSRTDAAMSLGGQDV